MMQLFALAAVVLYCGVSLGIGIRLLGLARRTRELPELCIGASFLAGGMFGYPLSVAASLLEASQPGLALAAHALGQAGMVTAASLLLVTWQVVFAREISWSRIFVGCWIGAVVVLGTAVVLGTRPDATRFDSNLYWPSLLAQAGAYALNAWASFRYQSMLWKRVRLGLGSPVVANRMLLWGISSTAITLQYAYAVATILLAHLGWPGLYQPGVIGALGLCAATCMTLAFFPPGSYLRRIERGAVSR